MRSKGKRLRAWFNTWFERLGPKSAPADLRFLLTDSAVAAGFDCIACGEIDLDEARRSVFFLNTWPQACFELYRRAVAVEFDPLLRHIRETPEPFSWARLSQETTPYSLRHTMATELRKRKVPESEVKGIMGHRRGLPREMPSVTQTI